MFVHRLVRGGVDPMAIRLVLMAHHYRSDWEWSEAELEEAGRRLTPTAAPHAAATCAPTPSRRCAPRPRGPGHPDRAHGPDAWAEGRELPAVPGTAAPTAEDAPGDVAAAVDALFRDQLRA